MRMNAHGFLRTIAGAGLALAARDHGALLLLIPICLRLLLFLVAAHLTLGHDDSPAIGPRADIGTLAQLFALAILGPSG